MFRKYRNFVHGVAAGLAGRTGVVLTTSSFVIFMLLEIARLLGIVTNAYLGLITYLLFPALFVIGLILIPIGWRSYKRRSGRSTAELLEERFPSDDIKSTATGNRLARTIALFTVINVVFLIGASAKMLSFMDEPRFCGTACHSVMNPEWVTYQQSPHSRVRCVDCHVGEGTEALIDSKLNGAYQMLSVTFDLFERPIPTPVHQLRPARETCEKCHWPEIFYGSRLKTLFRYKPDSASTRVFNTLNLKIDPDAGNQRGGVHWHIAAENEVRYASVGDEREQILWVDVLTPDGQRKRFTNTRLSGYEDDSKLIRVMDCVDCHNRVTHIYEDPAKAVDERIRLGLLDRSLPFLKREALNALSGDYPDKESGIRGIENQFLAFYQRNYPDVMGRDMHRILKQVSVLQDIYRRNIHPEMNIGWNAYPSHIGHVGNGGCFRCHNEALVADDGGTIAYDCATCHSILAYESREPFGVLQNPDTSSADYIMQQYLRDEFLNYYRTHPDSVH